LLRHGTAVRQPAGFGSEWDTLYYITQRTIKIKNKKLRDSLGDLRNDERLLKIDLIETESENATPN